MKVDLGLARRLEHLGVLNAADYVHTLKRIEPKSPAEVFAAGQGWGVLMGRDYPINLIQAAEFDLLSGADLNKAEARFTRLGLPARLSFCPLGLPQNLRLSSERGYRTTSFMNVYVQTLWPSEIQTPEGVEIRAVAGLAEWLEASQNAWGNRSLGNLFQQVALERPQAQSFLAIADGKPVAVAAMRIREGVAFLNGAGTAPAYQGRGIQRALIQTRLALAQTAGCDLAAVTAVPGSQSAHNLERLGFQLAYTRVSLEKSLAQNTI